MAKLRLPPAAAAAGAPLVMAAAPFLDYAAVAALAAVTGPLTALHAAAAAAAARLAAADFAAVCVAAPGRAQLLPRLHAELHGQSAAGRLVALTAAATVLEGRLAAAHRGQLAGPAAGSMLLSELLGTAELAAALPQPGPLGLLRTLFLPTEPTGVNLRNLIWHGFLLPAELPPEYGSLLLLLLLGLPAADDSSWWQLSTVDTALPAAYDVAAAGVLTAVPAACEELLAQSDLVGPGRGEVVVWALAALRRGDAVLFLLAVLPLLEHGLRRWFAVANAAPEYGLAQQEQYYSTLDGFGQRSKHQLLLALGVAVGGRRSGNRLLPLLGEGAVAVLTDLCMNLAGPNLRGKLAHGQIDLRMLYAPPPMPPPPTPRLVAMVLVLLVSLCERDPGGVAVRGGGGCLAGLGCGAVVAAHRPVFHPHALLSRAMARAGAAVVQLRRAAAERSWWHSQGANGMAVMTVAATAAKQQQDVIELHDQMSRLHGGAGSALTVAIDGCTTACDRHWELLARSVAGSEPQPDSEPEPEVLASMQPPGGWSGVLADARFYVRPGCAVWVADEAGGGGWAGVVLRPGGRSGTWDVLPVVACGPLAGGVEAATVRWQQLTARAVVADRSDTTAPAAGPAGLLFTVLGPGWTGCLKAADGDLSVQLAERAEVPIVEPSELVAAQPGGSEPAEPPVPPMVRCVLAVLEECARTATAWVRRLEELQRLVVSRDATTTQRRQFAAMVVAGEATAVALAAIAGSAEAHVRQSIGPDQGTGLPTGRPLFLKRLLNGAPRPATTACGFALIRLICSKTESSFTCLQKSRRSASAWSHPRTARSAGRGAAWLAALLRGCSTS